MSEKKFTPGPWEIHDSCSWRRIGTPGKDGNVLCPTTHPVDHHVDLICSEEDLALIAAAPDLYDALRSLLLSLNDVLSPDFSRALENSHAVLAKARGEA